MSVRSKGNTVVAIPLLCLIFSLIVSSLLGREIEEAEYWVKHTQEVRLQSERILRSMVDVQTGSRGYLLTQRQEFLRPYLSATNVLPTKLEKLEDLVQDNPSQLIKLQEINSLIDLQLDLTQRLLELPAEVDGLLVENPTTVEVLVQSKQIMDTIREQIDQFITVEENLLQQRRQYLEQQKETARAVLVLAGLAGVVGGLTASYLYSLGIARRIGSLHDNAYRLAAGQPLATVIPGQDEISQLDEALRSTAEQIAQRETELREASLLITEAAQKEKALIENSLDVICSINGEGRFVKVSPACLSLWGYEAEELVGRFYMELVDPDDLEKTAAVASETMAGTPTSEFENRYRRKDGSWVDVVWSAIWSEAEQLMFCVARDNTERKEVERLKNEFVSTVSHEIRTPLTSLRGFSELLIHKPCTPEKQREYLTIIRNESKRLTDLINDFLDIQRIESGRQNYDIEPVDLLPLIQETVSLFAQSSDKHQLRTEIPDLLPMVKADGDRIRQVLSNLISNAVKYSPEGGEVTVFVEEQESTLTVGVTDQGMGMSPEAMQKLFTKFYRVDSSNTRKIGGTGLGLALTKEIVEAHKGRIWVESEPDQGSTFYFTLPKVPATNPPVIGEVRSLKTVDILVVEDDTVFAQLLQEQLNHIGFSVVSTAFAEQALLLIEQNLPRLVFVDILLAGEMDGWDLLVTLKSNRKLLSLPVMVITSTEPNTRGLVFRGADYLPKSVPIEILVQSVKHHLPQLSGKTLLIADNDPAFRQQVVAALNLEANVRLIEVTNGREALEVVRQQMPDMLILDLMMPEMDGFELLRRLRTNKQALTIPVLVVTGVDLSPEEKNYFRSSMASLVNKQEATIEALARIVEQTLGVPREEISAEQDVLLDSNPQLNLRLPEGDREP